MRCRFCPNAADYFVAGDPVCESCDAIHRADLEDDAAMRAEMVVLAAPKAIRVVLVEGGKDESDALPSGH